MEYDKALSLAEKVLDLLAPACKCIEIAGSIRRQKPDPNDINLVAIPDLRPPRLSFGSPPYTTTLDAILVGLVCDDETFLIHIGLNGPKLKSFSISQDGGQHWLINVDLYLCTPPSDWGVLKLIRTGPKEFSHWIVTPKWQGGGLPNGYYVEDNRVLNRTTKENIPCLDEIDFLHFCKLDWISPSIRRPLWQRSVRKIDVRQPVKL